MANVHFELDINGLREIMKSAEMQSILSKAGAAVARAAGDGYGHKEKIASYEALELVYPVTKKTAREVKETNSLLKALGTAGLPMSK